VNVTLPAPTAACSFSFYTLDGGSGGNQTVSWQARSNRDCNDGQWTSSQRSRGAGNTFDRPETAPDGAGAMQGLTAFSSFWRANTTPKLKKRRTFVVRSWTLP
jgi:hypothetical protein